MVEITYIDLEENKAYETVIKTVIDKCYQEEGLENSKLIISITLTTPDKIQKINQMYRQIDQPTDVLSFPMFEKQELQQKLEKQDFIHEDILGDIIISIDQVEKQAQEYAHSFERELSYMVVHGFYHLMGYDHIEENDKRQMRPKEETVLAKLNLTRENG